MYCFLRFEAFASGVPVQVLRVRQAREKVLDEADSMYFVRWLCAWLKAVAGGVIATDVMRQDTGPRARATKGARLVFSGVIMYAGFPGRF